MIRIVTSTLSDYFGSRWYIIVPAIVVIILLPGSYYWYRGLVVFDEAKFAEEWAKIIISITFIYVIANMFTRKHSFELIIRRRQEILGKFYIHPLTIFIGLLNEHDQQFDAAKTCEQHRRELIAIWDQLCTFVEMQRKNQGSDLHFNLIIEEHLKNYRFEECRRLVDQLYRNSSSTDVNNNDRNKLVTMTEDLLENLNNARQFVREIPY